MSKRNLVENLERRARKGDRGAADELGKNAEKGVHPADVASFRIIGCLIAKGRPIDVPSLARIYAQVHEGIGQAARAEIRRRGLATSQEVRQLLLDVTAEAIADWFSGAGVGGWSPDRGSPLAAFVEAHSSAHISRALENLRSGGG